MSLFERHLGILYQEILTALVSTYLGKYATDLSVPKVPTLEWRSTKRMKKYQKGTNSPLFVYIILLTIGEV